MTSSVDFSASLKPDKTLVMTLAFLMGTAAFSVDGSLAAIPAIAEALQVSIGTAQLTVSIFLLGFGLGQIPMGFMADYFGRRNLLLISMSLFTLCGLLTAISPSAEILLLARLVQGFCAASAAVVSRATARDLTEGQETLRLMGLLTTTLGLTMIVGPLIGGLAMTGFGWRGTLGVSALFGVIGLLLAFVYLPETNRSERQSSALQTFLYSGKAFVRTPQALMGAMLAGLAFGGLMSYVTTSSDLLIRHYQISPLSYAISFSVVAAGYMLGGLSSRYLAHRYTPLALIRYTALAFLVCAGVLLAFLLGLPHPLWAVMVLVFCYFACVSAMLSQATTYTLEPLPKSVGMATAILGSLQLLTGAGISLLLALFNINSLLLLLAVLLVFALLIGVWVFWISPLLLNASVTYDDSGNSRFTK